MKKSWTGYLLSGVIIGLLAGCSGKPTDRGQQYIDGKLEKLSSPVNEPNTQGRPQNQKDFFEQINEIKYASASLYGRHSETYRAIDRWLNTSGGDTRQLQQFGLKAFQMEGADNYGNVLFTGYYTPVLQARYQPDEEFRYPIYRMPPRSQGRKLPSRAGIYRGELDKRYIAAYSNSLIDNFIMDVQGSGYVDFGNGQPLMFFGYGGKNGWSYTSIGRKLVERGEIKREEMSMQAIRQWAADHKPEEVRQLLEENDSFVFFRPESFAPVRGASAIPLIAKASVAADRSIIPPGTVLLAEVPLLNQNGQFTGQYEMRLMVALDVGGAIKGQHFDIYQGIGQQAGHMAGYYNHYGRVWILRTGSEFFSE